MIPYNFLSYLMVMNQSLLLLFLVLLVSPANDINFASCSESTSRVCSTGTNSTERLLSIKKGGSNILSTADYQASFFLCQQYNYNCGYIEEEGDFLTVANGVQLNLTTPQVNTVLASDATLLTKITPYLRVPGPTAKCASQVFPLVLTDAQSTTFMTAFLNRLASNLSSIYNTDRRNGTSAWADLNINIKTAVIEMAKVNMNENYIGSPFWGSFLENDFRSMSTQLKGTHRSQDCRQCLHAAYLIDAVTTRCNKYQSVNFLVDQSGSVGAPAFTNCLTFLRQYVTNTYDDISIMSLHFFASVFESYADFGLTRAQMLAKIDTKPYNAGGTFTGLAINATIAKIAAANYPNGVPKILIVMTDGGSADNVLFASNYARSLGITMFVIGMGSNINNAQLLQIAQTQSNIVYIDSYGSLNKLVSIIENYFCKQIVDVRLGEIIYGNLVREKTSPSFFRVQRNPSSTQFYKLSIFYEQDPELYGEEVRESHFDPFPNEFSQYPSTQNYRTQVKVKQYYISPQSQEEIPIKKVLTDTQTPTHAYVSVAGNYLKFNISLSLCAETDCGAQRAKASSIGSLNANSNGKDTDNNLTDTSIFLPICLGVGLMGLCTGGVMLGMRKFAEAPEEELPSANDIHEEIEPSQQEQEAQSDKKSDKSDKKSHKSDKSDKKSHKSDKKSHKSDKSDKKSHKSDKKSIKAPSQKAPSPKPVEKAAPLIENVVEDPNYLDPRFY